jgi:hypothetical protein
MSEIKSTLELVMEKTQHLGMSEAEKNREKNNQVRKQLRGVVQKYLDEYLNQNMVAKELNRLSGSGINIIPLLTQELLERIQIDRENSQIIQLLNRFCGISTNKLVSIIDNYHQRFQKARQQKTTEQKDYLLKNYKISGTAVVPLMDFDPQWKQQVSDLQENHQKFLESEKQNLVGLL